MKTTREKFQENDPITWLQVHNLFPIIVAIVSVVTAFSLLRNQVELNKQETDYLKSGVQSCTMRADQADKTLQGLQLKIQDISARMPAVKGISTERVTPTPKK